VFLSIAEVRRWVAKLDLRLSHRQTMMSPLCRAPTLLAPGCVTWDDDERDTQGLLDSVPVWASLRHIRFSSLAEANTAIRPRVTWLNNYPFAELGVTRVIAGLSDRAAATAETPTTAVRERGGPWGPNSPRAAP
jgi:hypothetical protein